MRKTEFRYLVLWVFLFGIIIIVFLQVISGYNINHLIKGNKILFKELKIQNDLRQLEADILTIESDIRGAVITGNPVHVKYTESKIRGIQNRIKEFKNSFDQQNPHSKINKLDSLISEKIVFSRLTLKTLYSKGKDSAEAIINTNRGNEIRD